MPDKIEYAIVECAIDQLGQALSDADRYNGGVICKERIQYAMRLLMYPKKD
jgi:hypothetical protein